MNVESEALFRQQPEGVSKESDIQTSSGATTEPAHWSAKTAQKKVLISSESQSTLWGQRRGDPGDSYPPMGSLDLPPTVQPRASTSTNIGQLAESPRLPRLPKKRLEKFAPHFTATVALGQRASPEAEAIICRVYNFIKLRYSKKNREAFLDLVCEATGVSRGTISQVVRRVKGEREMKQILLNPQQACDRPHRREKNIIQKKVKQKKLPKPKSADLRRTFSDSEFI